MVRRRAADTLAVTHAKPQQKPHADLSAYISRVGSSEKWVIPCSSDHGSNIHIDRGSNARALAAEIP